MVRGEPHGRSDSDSAEAVLLARRPVRAGARHHGRRPSAVGCARCAGHRRGHGRASRSRPAPKLDVRGARRGLRAGRAQPARALPAGRAAAHRGAELGGLGPAADGRRNGRPRARDRQPRLSGAGTGLRPQALARGRRRRGGRVPRARPARHDRPAGRGAFARARRLAPEPARRAAARCARLRARCRRSGRTTRRRSSTPAGRPASPRGSSSTIAASPIRRTWCSRRPGCERATRGST